MASRSIRLIREARSLVAASGGEIIPTSAITKYVPNSIIKEGVNENPYHRSLREYLGGLVLLRTCSETGRGQTFFLGVEGGGSLPWSE